MNRKCDLCELNEAVIENAVLVNGVRTVYSFCEKCYDKLNSSGLGIQTVMQEKLNKVGKVCPDCGCTLEEFEKTMLFGCPSCYLYMRVAAFSVTERLQGVTLHRGKRI